MLPPDFGLNFPKEADSPMLVGSFSAAATAACTVAFAPLWLAAEVLPELDGLLPEPELLDEPELQAARAIARAIASTMTMDVCLPNREPGLLIRFLLIELSLNFVYISHDHMYATIT
jgi:hypothetical protein